jgi:hypothetical protein
MSGRVAKRPSMGIHHAISVVSQKMKSTFASSFLCVFVFLVAGLNRESERGSA